MDSVVALLILLVIIVIVLSCPESQERLDHLGIPTWAPSRISIPSNHGLSRENFNSDIVDLKNAKDLVYLDNNGTTIPPPFVETEIKKWVGSGNPSSENAPAKQLIKYARNYLYDHMKISPDEYDIVFTSGASESNSLLIKSVTENYKNNTGRMPHVIISSMEHKSILNLVKLLERLNCCEYTLVEPDIYGKICPADVDKEIKGNTCLVSIMWANNEIGTINNIPAISHLCRIKHVPFHTDATQIFGKYYLPIGQPIDAVSMAFHKVYGPPGTGILVVHKRMKMHAQIGGMQEGGLRGGTENVPGIAGAIAGMKYSFEMEVLEHSTRAEKNAYLAGLRQRMIDNLSEIYPITPYDLQFTSRSNEERYPVELVILGPAPDNGLYGLPNTLAFSIVKHYGPRFCNIKLKRDLMKEGFMISIGSACNSSQTGPSHVLQAILAPPEVGCGTVRISLGDTNTESEVDKFVAALVKCAGYQLEKWNQKPNLDSGGGQCPYE